MESCSGKQLFLKKLGSKRPSLENLSTDLFPDGGIKRGNLVEISGTSVSCGKTQLMMEIIVKTVLPRSLGGKEASVILYNLDHHFCSCFFERIIRKYTKDDLLIHESFQRLKIVDIFIPEEFRNQLKQLDEHLLLKDKSVALVAIDSLGAFYYLEEDESIKNMYKHYKHYIDILKSIIRHHQTVIVYSLPYFYSPKQDGSLTMSNYRFHLDELTRNSERSVNIRLSFCGSIFKLKALYSKQGLQFYK